MRDTPQKKLPSSPGEKLRRNAARTLPAKLRKEPNELKRKMLLLGFLSDELSRRGGFLFLVGGQAVETYTAGLFTTGDVDVTTTDREATESLLKRLGFEREGMVWLSEKLGIAVHIVGSYPTRTEKVRTVEVGPYRVRIIGVEELIVDRLRAAKFWKSERDSEQAAALLYGFRARIDMEYLEKRAKRRTSTASFLRLGRRRGLDYLRPETTFEDPEIEMCFELSSAMFSMTMSRIPNSSMKELTSAQSMLLPVVLMKRDNLVALKRVILSGGLNASLAPMTASGVRTWTRIPHLSLKVRYGDSLLGSNPRNV